MGNTIRADWNHQWAVLSRKFDTLQSGAVQCGESQVEQAEKRETKLCVGKAGNNRQTLRIDAEPQWPQVASSPEAVSEASCY
jgi:hypothetical protein